MQYFILSKGSNTLCISLVQQATYSVHLHAANLVYAYTSAFCCKLCGMYKRSSFTGLLFSSEDGVRRGGSAACAAIVVTDALLEKPKRRRKKWINDYLLERTTKGSYGGLLTELSLEKEIFKEYKRMIQSISVSSVFKDTLYSVFLFTSEILYTTEIRSISASCSHTVYVCMTPSSSIAATPNDLPP